jgi:hypothetical protein
MLVPILRCNRGVGDVWLLGVVLGVPIWLRSAGHGTSVLGVDGRHDGEDEGRTGEKAV